MDGPKEKSERKLIFDRCCGGTQICRRECVSYVPVWVEGFSLLENWAAVSRVDTSVITSGLMHVRWYHSAKTTATVSLRKELFIHPEGRSYSDLFVSLRAVQCH